MEPERLAYHHYILSSRQCYSLAMIVAAYLVQKQQAFSTFDFSALRAEVQTVEAAAAALHSPLVFAHNDLLSGVLTYMHRLADRPASQRATDQPTANWLAEC